MVNLTAAERVYEYWIDKASSAADLVLKIVFCSNSVSGCTQTDPVALRSDPEKHAAFSHGGGGGQFHRFHGEIQSEHAAGADHYRSARYRIRSVDRSSHRLRRRCRIPGIAGRPLKLCRRGDDSAAEAI